jgi:hypothetical protein
VFTLVPVEGLPTTKEGIADCAEVVGCPINAVRLIRHSSQQCTLTCWACRHFLSYEPGRGWRLTIRSREEIERARDEAREQYEPVIGAGWQQFALLQQGKAKKQAA